MRRAVFCALAVCVAFAGRGQCLSIYGTITDAYTGKPVSGVSINHKIKERSMPLSKSAASGTYRIGLPCDAAMLAFEANGYRAQQIPLSLVGNASGRGYEVPVRLVPTDRQAVDQPYFQEQQRFVALNGPDEKKGNVATRLFKVTDALSGKVVPAELCLYYTKSGKKDCQQLSSAQPGYEVTFTDADIIAIEVKSKNYQSYFGNLILDKLDNEQRIYAIRLSAQPYIVSVVVNGDGQKIDCRISGVAPLKVHSTDGIHFSSALPAAGNYRVELMEAGGRQLYSQEISVRPGANLYAVDLPSTKPVATATHTLSQASASDIGQGARVIYFDKSDYRLREESKTVLDTLVQWLALEPSRSLKIVGHTDNVGKSELNQTLSEYRARLTYHFLEQRGADAKRMTYIGKGDSFPAAPNDMEVNRMKNRRVEIQLVSKP